jgi:hypothetical protein
MTWANEGQRDNVERMINELLSYPLTLYFSYAISLQYPPEHPIPLIPLDRLARDIPGVRPADEHGQPFSGVDGGRRMLSGTSQSRRQLLGIRVRSSRFQGYGLLWVHFALSASQAALAAPQRIVIVAGELVALLLRSWRLVWGRQWTVLGVDDEDGQQAGRFLVARIFADPVM